MFKTTIVIWSDTDPSGMSLSELGADAHSGDSYCSKQVTEEKTAEDTLNDPEWDGTEFFGEIE